MRAIALDVGDKDPFVTTNRQLNEALTRLNIADPIEVYDGDHGNRVGERFASKVLPFFSTTPRAALSAARSPNRADEVRGVFQTA